jgi:hypothetical protein
MFARVNRSFWAWSVIVPLAFVAGCRDEYERMPAATDAETQALTELYKRLLDDARKVKPEEGLKLIKHFSSASLSGVSVPSFQEKATKFIGEVGAGKWDKLEVRGARAPSRVRLLLVTTAAGKLNVPFVQATGGWKLDDVDIAFGDLEKKFNDKGAVVAFPPQITSSLAMIQDPLASSKEKVKEALRLADAANKEMLASLLSEDNPPLVKASLLYAQWKAGAGTCETFSKAFPIEKAQQKELFDGDVDSYRVLLAGLIECAATSKDPEPMLRLYKGCHQAEDATRSEYVEPVVQLATAKPELVLKAATQAGLKFEEDPVANIVVGALHGEAQSPMVLLLNQQAKGAGKQAGVAKLWVQKMAERDQAEPPAPEGGGATE